MLYLLSYVVVEPSPIIMTPLRYSLPSLKIVLMLKLWLFHFSLLQMSWWHKWIITCGFVTCKSSILFLLRFLFIKKMVTMTLKLSLFQVCFWRLWIEALFSLNYKLFSVNMSDWRGKLHRTMLSCPSIVVWNYTLNQVTLWIIKLCNVRN